MPTYVYKCSECGADLEAVQSMVDEPLTHCGCCGLESLRRVVQQIMTLNSELPVGKINHKKRLGKSIEDARVDLKKAKKAHSGRILED